MIIQDIEYTDRYIRITLDTGESMRVENTSIPMGLLHKGAMIDIDAYTLLKEEAHLFECKEKVLSYISIRNRTEHDIKKYLVKKGFDKNTINRVIQDFSEKGLINDYSYALQYIQSIRDRKTVGNKIIEKKLFEKGIDKSVIKKAIKRTQEKEPNSEQVYQLALLKYNRIKDKENAIAKVASFLYQRGFSWEIIKKVIKKLGNGSDNLKDELQE
ncbi:MAG: RecX family transcriptional regulator [Spirochaetes bacterium]|nr:RecX family transcriptional regulator [Spirochaetota bacterium]